jgi:ADP-ribosylglycohydrolase
MIGALTGDIIGSVHEFARTKRVDFPLFEASTTFTDDSVLSIAVADSILSGELYVDMFHRYTRAYPGRGYGLRYLDWARSESRAPYNSWGNGSAMRVSPVGYAFDDPQSVLDEARRSAEVTHNHPEGIKGAQATALAIFMARTGGAKEEIRSTVQSRFGYDLSRTVESIRPGYGFNESCHGTVPEAIIAFLDSDDYETAIRLAISLGGDADTLACITGGIAAAFYGGVPRALAEPAMALLDPPLRQVVDRFCARFAVPGVQA